jgi:hypothetical protein
MEMKSKIRFKIEFIKDKAISKILNSFQFFCSRIHFYLNLDLNAEFITDLQKTTLTFSG